MTGVIIFSIMRAMIENIISPDYVLCYIPRSLEVPWKMWTFWNSLGRRRQPLWYRRRPLGVCNFENFRENFGICFGNFWQIWYFGKLWVIISKVGGQLSRKEGNIGLKWPEVHFHVSLGSNSARIAIIGVKYLRDPTTRGATPKHERRHPPIMRGANPRHKARHPPTMRGANPHHERRRPPPWRASPPTTRGANPHYEGRPKEYNKL